MIVYISGQITGLNLSYAILKFAETEQMLKKKGYVVVNPLSLHDLSVEGSWKDYMAVDIRHLFDCDAIYMQRDWIGSKGARIEFAIAKELGLKILYEDEELF